MHTHAEAEIEREVENENEKGNFALEIPMALSPR